LTNGEENEQNNKLVEVSEINFEGKLIVIEVKD